MPHMLHVEAEYWVSAEFHKPRVCDVFLLFALLGAWNHNPPGQIITPSVMIDWQAKNGECDFSWGLEGGVGAYIFLGFKMLYVELSVKSRYPSCIFHQIPSLFHYSQVNSGWFGTFQVRYHGFIFYSEVKAHTLCVASSGSFTLLNTIYL